MARTPFVCQLIRYVLSRFIFCAHTQTEQEQRPETRMSTLLPCVTAPSRLRAARCCVPDLLSSCGTAAEGLGRCCARIRYEPSPSSTLTRDRAPLPLFAPDAAPTGGQEALPERLPEEDTASSPEPATLRMGGEEADAPRTASACSVKAKEQRDEDEAEVE